MSAVFVDRAGDVWRTIGRDSDGDVLLECSSPSGTADRGEGASFPWTHRTVTMWFGPLVEATPDAEMAHIAAVDATLHELYGINETAWSQAQTVAYLAAIAAEHGRFHPEQVAA